MLFYAFAVIVLLVDQLSKYLVRFYMNVGDTAIVWKWKLIHYENAGMAFSLFQGYARLFAVVAILFVGGVLYYRRSEKQKGIFVEIGLGFLVGGAVGNAIDRILFGRVTDFLVSSSGKGILNLADHAINIGILLLILSSIIQYMKKKRTAR